MRRYLFFIGLGCAGLTSCLLLRTGAATTVAAIGGPLPNLRTFEQKENLMHSHFASLEREEENLARESRALKRVMVRASREGDSRRLANLSKRKNELRLINVGIRDARSVLLSLQRNQDQYEQLLTASYQPIQKKSKRSHISNRPYETSGSLTFAWPVVPEEGISAGFRDGSYSARFGFQHDAIDIPAEQGTPVFAPEDGTVVAVNERGYGYNTIFLEHDGGVTTVYGHLSKFLVEKGDYVRKGELIAASGGRPGSKGAGLLTTGPHLHFEVRLHDQAIDPLYYLMPMEVTMSEAY